MKQITVAAMRIVMEILSWVWSGFWLRGAVVMVTRTIVARKIEFASVSRPTGTVFRFEPSFRSLASLGPNATSRPSSRQRQLTGM